MRYILISIDSLRYDIAEEEGLTALFEFSHPNYYTSSNWTLPAHAAMLVGDSINHNCHWNWSYPEREGETEQITEAKEGALRGTTIAEIMRVNGYETIGYVGGGFVNKWFGFDRGFDFWDETDRFGDMRFPEGAIPELPDNSFVFIHTWIVHNYFDEVSWDLREFRLNQFVQPEVFADLITLSEGKQAYRDRVKACTELVEVFLTNYKDDIVILTGDHGEVFLEDGKQIHHGVYADLKDVWISRVPLCANNLNVDAPSIMFDVDLKNLILGHPLSERILRGHYSFAGSQYIYTRGFDSWTSRFGDWECLLT